MRQARLNSCTDCGEPCYGNKCRACWRANPTPPTVSPCACLACCRTFQRWRAKNYKQGEAKYCSRDCCFSDKAKRKKRRQEEKRIETGLVSWARAWAMEFRGLAPQEAKVFSCEFCKKKFRADTHGKKRKYCSPDCYRAHYSTKCPQIIKVECARCGKLVTRRTKNSTGHACKLCRAQSTKEWKKAYKEKHGRTDKYRSRCKRYGGKCNQSCTPQAVFKRDGCKCHVCGVVCRTEKKYYNRDDYATIDHFPMPLSKGGDHDWHNVKTCCRKCNSIKGAEWSGQKVLSFQ